MAGSYGLEGLKKSSVKYGVITEKTRLSSGVAAA